MKISRRGGRKGRRGEAKREEKTVTVTVTEALVLRPLLEDRGCITESGSGT